jgi:hypothetical protein
MDVGRKATGLEDGKTRQPSCLVWGSSAFFSAGKRKIKEEETHHVCDGTEIHGLMALISELTAPAFGGSNSFESFDVPGLYSAYRWKINNAGQIIGEGSTVYGHQQSFLKNGNTYNLMAPFGLNYGSVAGITSPVPRRPRQGLENIPLEPQSGSRLPTEN